MDFADVTANNETRDAFIAEIVDNFKANVDNIAGEEVIVKASVVEV